MSQTFKCRSFGHPLCPHNDEEPFKTLDRELIIPEFHGTPHCLPNLDKEMEEANKICGHCTDFNETGFPIARN